MDILDVSVKPDKVALRYREALEAFGLKEGTSDEGSIGWQAVSGIIHMMVHPGLVSPSMDAIGRRVRNSLADEPFRPLHPAPELVGEIYAVPRGSKGKGKFWGIGSGLPGSKTRQLEAKTVLPACAAWFLAGEDARPGHEAKTRITQILNERLLRPHGLKVVYDVTGEFNQLWRNVRKHEPDLKRLKWDTAKKLRNSEFKDGYFSARDISERRPENK